MAVTMDFVLASKERQKEFDELRAKENGKDRLIEKLFEQIESMNNTLRDTEDELENQRKLAKLYKEEFKDLEVTNRARQQELARTSYVMVLVDGDGMLFNDGLVTQGEEGGKEAARMVMRAANDYVKDAVVDLPAGVKVVVRVYANVEGLGKTYRSAGILKDPLQFFIRGFNMAALCDFVDVGHVKESADEKLKESFKLHIDDLHCRHIIFCASTDNGFSHLLRPYEGNEVSSKRITLLEGPPFATELAKLKDKFATTSFPSVFRSTKLQVRRVSFGGITPPATPAPNYASAAARVPTPTAATATAGRPSTEPSSRTQVLRNAKGQRVDSTLRFSPADIGPLMKTRLCHQFHILGSCAYDTCLYPHGTRLVGKQLDALRHLARLSPCGLGLRCDDPGCIYGHRCTKPSCHNRGDCRFSREMHDVDVGVV